ncbi:PREDICTED: tektin-2 [Ficedula albicollis]|uniref:tektin-2 n=1 Tax=Ficedula albicollis TaxID=59894 RepID=UPI0003599F0B|nr:PREDICTED: tektin-2 [Ficedula albicollis]XP_005058349.1 PREDICTED: tektin-2 [Ficedula albicollis]XP_005058350.1 PREDICTED: tektin-2 [Ficedula albicollis]XP_005058351.1 PREDICTED: tektin-2 [Ficedula albicollis]
MASLSVKPGQRFTLPDWQNNSILISADAEQQRYNSHHIRQEGRALRNETGNHARWDEHNSRTQLKDRITTVDRWRETLARLLTEIDLEIDALTKIKEAAENAIQAKNLCLDVAIECLTFRESRRDIDVVRDPVEEELLREVKVIEKTKKELQQRVDDAFKQLCLLKEARQQLSSDYRHKVEALELDRQCVSFNPTSGNISFKVNPTRVPYGTTALSEWEQTSQRNKELAEAALKASVDLRGAITLTIAQTNNELDAQRIATEFALRKRIRDMEAALNELRWQEQNTLEEIAEVEEDIRQLEEEIRKRTLDLKVAHTRLETRTYRPHIELCRDQAQYGLTDEVQQLEAIIRALQQKRTQLQDALDALYRQLHRIQTDIGYKTNSLQLDNKCMDTRKKLVIPVEKFEPEVDAVNRTRNLPRSSQLELA